MDHSKPIVIRQFLQCGTGRQAGKKSPALGQRSDGVVPHPSAEILVRFAEGTSRRAEAREVVRHLLRGCRVCSALVAGQISILDVDVYEPIFRRVFKELTS